MTTTMTTAAVTTAAMTTALDTLPLTPPATAPPAPRLRRMRYEPEPGGGGPPQPPPAPPARTPPAVPAIDHADRDTVRTALAGTLQLAMEVLDGRRPPAHLSRQFDPAPLRYWRAAAQQRRVRSPARATRLVLCRPHADAAELAVVCHIDGKVRALAARFERNDPTTGWRCTAIRLG
jgi:hypothetical protein